MFEEMTKHELELRLREACAKLRVRYEVTMSTEVAREMLRQAAADGADAVVQGVLQRAAAERRQGRSAVADALEAAVSPSSLAAGPADYAPASERGPKG